MYAIVMLSAVGLPILAMGLTPYLAAWPVALSGAVVALAIYVKLDLGLARSAAAAEYQKRNDELASRTAAMVAEYHEVMAGVNLQVAIDRRDRRDLQDERQKHEREKRELRAELAAAQERIKGLPGRRKKTPKVQSPEGPMDGVE